MRRSPVRFSRSEALNRTLSLVDFITTTFESRFSVHTPPCAPVVPFWWLLLKVIHFDQTFEG